MQVGLNFLERKDALLKIPSKNLLLMAVETQVITKLKQPQIITFQTI